MAPMAKKLTPDDIDQRLRAHITSLAELRGSVEALTPTNAEGSSAKAFALAQFGHAIADLRSVASEMEDIRVE